MGGRNNTEGLGKKYNYTLTDAKTNSHMSCTSSNETALKNSGKETVNRN
jgi:hypothetical protein